MKSKRDKRAGGEENRLNQQPTTAKVFHCQGSFRNNDYY